MNTAEQKQKITTKPNGKNRSLTEILIYKAQDAGIHHEAETWKNE